MPTVIGRVSEAYILRLFAFAIIFAPPRLAQAWHEKAHMAVARIAWEELADTGLRPKLIEILRHHPHRDLFLTVDRPPEIDVDEWMFARAAAWPDWVRSPQVNGKPVANAAAINKQYMRSSWHFINLPVIATEELNRFDLPTITKTCVEPELDNVGEPRHALSALSSCTKQLNSKATSPEDRAVALCWVLHLIGDIHQPLHCSTLVSCNAQFQPQQFLPPQGDNGGNRVAVKVKITDDRAIELHAFWDSQDFGDMPYSSARKKVLSWIRDSNFTRSRFCGELKKTSPSDWATESNLTAKTFVYFENGELLKAYALPPRHDPTDLLGLQAPVLSKSYRKTAKAVAKRQIILAGYRLTNALRGQFSTHTEK